MLSSQHLCVTLFSQVSLVYLIFAVPQTQEQIVEGANFVFLTVLAIEMSEFFGLASEEVVFLLYLWCLALWWLRVVLK